MLKQMVIENGWSAFNLAKPGIGGAMGGVWFKSVDYDLTPEKVAPSQHVKSIWIYSRPL